jgi:hypothetical protein
MFSFFFHNLDSFSCSFLSCFSYIPFSLLYFSVFLFFIIFLYSFYLFFTISLVVTPQNFYFGMCNTKKIINFSYISKICQQLDNSKIFNKNNIYLQIINIGYMVFYVHSCCIVCWFFIEWKNCISKFDQNNFCLS